METPYPDFLPPELASIVGELAEEAVATGRRTKQDLCHDVPRIHHSTAHIKSWAGLDDCFPRPPWGGTARLRPVLSSEGVRREGRRFRNCVRQRTDEYESGMRTLFVWDGPPPVMVSIMFLGARPFIREMSGIANADVDPETARTITAEVAHARQIQCQI